jgi:hypothetical protein
MKKTAIYWIIAVLITVLVAYYQRVTGPTHPVKDSVEIAGETTKLKFLRSHGGEGDGEIVFNIANQEVSGEITFRKYPTDEPWTTAAMVRDGETLTASLPHQPAAGKMEYYVSFSHGNDLTTLGEEQPIVFRFKGAVPAWLLIIHIAAMFFTFLFTTYSGILAFRKDDRFFKFLLIAILLLLVGGFFLGPWVQLYAFDEWWAGVPFGWDLTDNKTLLALLALGVAWLLNRKDQSKPIAVVIAVIIVLGVFLIPHSMFGSTLDHSTGVIERAMLMIR